MQMLFSSFSLCFSVSSRASCLALSAASMSFLAVWELSDSWEPEGYRQHKTWGQHLVCVCVFVCVCVCGCMLWGHSMMTIVEGKEIVHAPVSLAGCLQGSECRVSIRKLSFSVSRKGQLRTKSVTQIVPVLFATCLVENNTNTTTHTHSVSLCLSLLLSLWPSVVHYPVKYSNKTKLTTAETCGSKAFSIVPKQLQLSSVF